MLQNLTVSVAAVILVFSLWLAIQNGKAEARSKMVVKNFGELEKALKYFYNDQNRFPSTVEFNESSESNILKIYSNNFPPENFVSKQCPQTFVYKQLKPNTYELNFCLERSVPGFKKGWNKKVQGL